MVPEGSPQLPCLKSPLPIQSPQISSGNDNPPPILPKETDDIDEEQSIEGEMKEKEEKEGESNAKLFSKTEIDEDVSSTISKVDLENEKSPQKRLRGRKRKLEPVGDSCEAEPVKSSPNVKKRPLKTNDTKGKRKASLPISSTAKRSRRKTLNSKSTGKSDEVPVEQEDVELGAVDSTEERLKVEEDEDTMAASAAPTEMDDLSVTPMTTTTEETAPDVFLKRPRPPPRVRVPRPKKKK